MATLRRLGRRCIEGWLLLGAMAGFASLLTIRAATRRVSRTLQALQVGSAEPDAQD